MLQVPVEIRVTVSAVTVQTAGVLDEKVTVRPEDAVAEMVTGDWARVRPGSAAKVIFWLAWLTVKLRVTVGAGP